MDTSAAALDAAGARTQLRFLEYCSHTPPRPGQVLRRRRAVAFAATFVGALTLLAAIASNVLLTFDEPASDWTRRQGSSGFWRSLSYVGGTEVYLPVAVIATLVLWNRCRSLAITWAGLTVLSVVVNMALKIAVDRARPEAPITGVSLASYPSGHVIHATVLLGLLVPTAYILTRKSWIAWATGMVGGVLLLAIMYSRVALGAHWPTDVVAGFAVGAALLIGSDLVVDLRETRRPPQLANLHPAKWPARSP